jgi:transposase
MDGDVALFAGNAFLWKENQRLREALELVREQLRQRDDAAGRAGELQQRCDRLSQENVRLRQQVAELSQELQTRPKAKQPPAWVKPNTRGKSRKRPGRKAGHAAALRPAPLVADVHRDLPLPVDAQGKVSCPHCNTQLNQVRTHQRWVEDLIPARTITTCYHTQSGYCPCCRKTIESRADEQPPAADVPHAQLGLNALSTAAVMRVCYRLPLRQITQLFADLPGLKLSPAAISKQLLRLSRWLEGQYHRLKLVLRASGVVYADETSWRQDGKNAQLWTITSDTHTLYHIDKSRSGKVIADLMGKGFGSDGSSTLVSDFYGVYNQFDCPQQKCLAHLLRELKDLTTQNLTLAADPFFKRCRRLIKDMLRLNNRRGQLTASVYEHQVQLVEKRLKELGSTSWDQPDAVRLATRLRKHEGKLTTFLHNPKVQPTNNAAERALRPAVIHRKITGGNRSEQAAKAWAILASILKTAQQQGRDVLQTLQTLLKAHWSGQEITLLTDLLTPTPSILSSGR